MAFETLCPNTLVKPSTICRNFICYEEKVMENLQKEDRKEAYKHDENIQRDFNAVVSFKTQIRNGMATVGADDVCLEPVSLDAETKKCKYIYKLCDWGDLKKTPIFGSREKITKEIFRRVKSGQILLNFLGKTNKETLTEDMISRIFDEAQIETYDVNIVPLGKNNTEGDIIGVTIFKNLI